MRQLVEHHDRWFIVCNVPAKAKAKEPEPECFAVGPFDSAAQAHFYGRGWRAHQVLRNPVFAPEYHVLYPTWDKE